MSERFVVAYNLRASGKELARRRVRKGEIRVTKSGFGDLSTSNCIEEEIVDTVIVADIIDIKNLI